MSSQSTASKKYPTLIKGDGCVFEKEVALRIYNDILPKHGVDTVDTARAYPGSEEQLGELGIASRFRIITKFSFTPPKGPGEPPVPGYGKRDALFKSAEESLKALKVQKVDTWLLHIPDPSTSVSETMEAIQELYKQGKFEHFGLSNFSVDQVKEFYEYAKSKSYILPTVYQGNYNLLARRNEVDLFPLLRSLNISFQAYSPIAGGFLVKTPEQINNPPEGSRWHLGNFFGKMYQSLYNKPSMMEYLRQFGELSEKSGVSKLGLSYRWVRYHSALSGEHGDSVVFGVTSEKQVDELLTEVEKGPLEDWVVKKLDEMWKNVEKDAPYNNLNL